MEEIPVQEPTAPLVIQTPAPIEPPPVKKPFLSKTIIAVFVIVLILILLPAGAYLFLNSNKQVACTTEAKICPDGSSVGRTGPKCEFAKCPIVTPTPQAVTLPTLSSSEAATWKTFEDPDKTFSIKYPNSITFYDHGGYTDRRGDDVDFYIDSPSAIEPRNGLPIAPRLSIWWRGYGDKTPAEVAKEELFGQTQKIIKFNNVYGVQMEDRFDYYFADKFGNNPVYRITYNDYPNRLEPKAEERLLITFSKMLTTFKFTHSTSDTSTWKTYVNKDYRFSLKYPQKFTLTEDVEKNIYQETSNPTNRYLLSFSTGTLIYGQPDFSGFSIDVTSNNRMTIDQYYKGNTTNGDPKIIKHVTPYGNAVEAAELTCYSCSNTTERFGNYFYAIIPFQNANLLLDGNDQVNMDEVLSTIKFAQ